MLMPPIRPVTSSNYKNSLPEPVPRSRNCMERSVNGQCLRKATVNVADQNRKYNQFSFLRLRRYSASAKRIKFLKRLTHIGHMDFQFAFWQMVYLFVSPQKVFRDFVYRKRKLAKQVIQIFLSVTQSLKPCSAFIQRPRTSLLGMIPLLWFYSASFLLVSCWELSKE